MSKYTNIAFAAALTLAVAFPALANDRDDRSNPAQVEKDFWEQQHTLYRNRMDAKPTSNLYRNLRPEGDPTISDGEEIYLRDQEKLHREEPSR